MATSFNQDDNPNNTDDHQDDTNTPKGGDQTTTFEYNGKQMTLEEVRNKLTNADQHIATLEQERQTDRERVEKLISELEKAESKGQTMQEVIDRLGGGDNKPNADEPKDPKPVDEDKLAERAAEAALSRMSEKEKERKIKENQQYVSGLLKEKYGDKVDEEVFSVTRELGYTDEEAFEEAGKRPKAFLRMIGLDSTDNKSKGKFTHGTERNRYSQDVTPDANDVSRKVVGANSTKNRMAAWENRVQEKLKQLGIET